MANQNNISAQMAVGGSDLGALRRAARDNSPEALKAVAQQFEALLVNMMLKSMRDATPKSGLFESEQTKLYTSLLDQQLSQNFAKRGIGLADALLRQLSNNGSQGLPTNNSSDALKSSTLNQTLVDIVRQQQASLVTNLSSQNTNEAISTDSLSKLFVDTADQQKLAISDELRTVLADSIRNKQALLPAERMIDNTIYSSNSHTSRPTHVRAFQEKVGSHAEEASRATGIPAKFMLGQAALESGWGKNVMVKADGTSSHNLFGIKATKGWSGKVVETTTTEYVNGVAYRKKEKFRAYDSYADSFKDYARLLKTSPRYQNVLANSNDASSFAQGLQRAGYATDPQYAAKLTRIIQKSLST
jgi:peptidoglycan hydrolase FlgJ